RGARRVGRARRGAHRLSGRRRGHRDRRPLPVAPMKVVLFDIDGTLLLSDGAGRLAMETALRGGFGSSGPATHRYDGKTAKLIVREAMRMDGVSDAEIDARMDEVLAHYVAGLTAHLADGTRRAYTLPGVPALLDAVEACDDLVLGLLTGNLEVGARTKLGAV